MWRTMNKPIAQSKFGTKYKDGYDSIFKRPELSKYLMCFAEVEFGDIVQQTYCYRATADDVIPSLLKWKTFVGTHGAKIDGMSRSTRAEANVGRIKFRWFAMSMEEYEAYLPTVVNPEYFSYSHARWKPLTNVERAK